MAVAFDAQTNPATFSVTSPFTFVHTPVGTPKGVTVPVTMIVAAGNVTAITYGGVAMTIILNKISSNSFVEQGRSLIAFLGTGIPSGAQTVSITHNGLGVQCQTSCVTYTAGADTEVGASGFDVTDSTTPNAITTTSVVSLRHGAVFSSTGTNLNLTAFAGMSVIGASSNGFRSARHDRQTAPSAGAFDFGYTDTGANEQALVVLAVQEGTAPPAPPAPSTGGNRMGGTGAIRRPPRNVRN